MEMKRSVSEEKWRDEREAARADYLTDEKAHANLAHLPGFCELVSYLK